DGRLQVRVPVDQALAADDQPVFEQIEERVADRSRADFIQREPRTLPVARAAHELKLLEDAVAILLLPFPDAADQLIAAQIVTRFLLGFEDALLDHGLRVDAGVIGSGPP